MGRKRKDENIVKAVAIPQNISDDLVKELDTNPEYSLEVDPTNKYNMSIAQKSFIENYVQFKSIPMAAELTGISLDQAKSYFVAYDSQSEIRRISRAMYQRQFSQKLLSIDEIGGYLTSLLTDENVPLADQLKTTDKLRVAQMLIDLQKYKNEAIANPENIIDVNIEDTLKDLSVDTIKQLIYSSKSKNDAKPEVNNEEVVENPLTPEEDAFLKTLPTDQLLEIIEESNKDDK